MRVALLAGANSIHTARWANGLSAEGVRVFLISQHPVQSPMDKRVEVNELPYAGPIGYFANVPRVRRLLKGIGPDVVNAHYAVGYGTTAQLVNYRPWILSVWGSDVYDFPFKSALHRLWVASNLEAADAVASTSHCMAVQTKAVARTLRDVYITPFGVDCTLFSPLTKQSIVPAANTPIVIGTVKALAPQYGIDLLINAFALAKGELSTMDYPLAARLQLRVVGDGPDRDVLTKLAASLGISDCVEFVGAVPHDEVPTILRGFNMFMALSRREGFGVSAVEASAVGLPVIVSDVGGLPEVVLDGQTGLVVPPESPKAAAGAIIRLLMNPTIGQKLGEQGRAHVLTNYSWKACVESMLDVYRSVVSKQSRASLG